MQAEQISRHLRITGRIDEEGQRRAEKKENNSSGLVGSRQQEETRFDLWKRSGIMMIPQSAEWILLVGTTFKENTRLKI